MPKKDKKSKTAEQKARVAAKQTKKAAQKEKKVKLKGSHDSDAEDIDLESVLQKYAEEQAQFLKVTELACESPSPRASAALIGSPSNSNELFLFGGEYYNGAHVSFFNDLFIYLVDRSEWRKVTSPNSPLPRSGHAWCRGGNSGGVYLFGGEFSSPKQGTFYHYNDFWHLEPSSREWTRLEVKGTGPPARSGHRMTYFKNYILIFGGFQDTSQQTRYLQDLWIYDCHNYTWHSSTQPISSLKPDARSSFSFLPHDSGAVIYGGYSRVKANVAVGKQSKGNNQGNRTVQKPVLHRDTWLLRISQPPSHANTTAAPMIRWERRKKPANPPNPPRAGATMAYHKGRGIMFGGVHDVEESEEGIDSEFFNGLFAWNIDRNRFFPLSLRQPRGPAKQQQQQIMDRENTKRNRAKADGEELLRNLAALETSYSVATTDMEKADRIEKQDTGPTKSFQPVLMTMPKPRFNAQLTVQDDVLYIFGGTYEHGDREYTFDEMYAVDLGKLDGVKEIYRKESGEWQPSDGEETDSEEDDNSDLSQDSVMDAEISSRVPLPRDEVVGAPTSTIKVPENLDIDMEDEMDEIQILDNLPQPRPFESLRDFFSRTTSSWQELVLSSVGEVDSNSDHSVKELRKGAFELAERKWWDSREEITLLEEEQENAGIGEVVSMTERGGENNGIGRRR